MQNITSNPNRQNRRCYEQSNKAMASISCVGLRWGSLDLGVVRNVQQSPTALWLTRNQGVNRTRASHDSSGVPLPLAKRNLAIPVKRLAGRVPAVLLRSNHCTNAGLRFLSMTDQQVVSRKKFTNEGITDTAAEA